MQNPLKRLSFGMALGLFQEADEGAGRPAGWFVASRLLESPAAKAGIIGNYREQLLSIGSKSVGTERELAAMLQTAYTNRETPMKFRVWATGEVIRATLSPYRIWRWPGIPIHPMRYGHSREDYEAGKVTRGMAYCRRTGYFFPTSRLTEEGLQMIFRS